MKVLRRIKTLVAWPLVIAMLAFSIPLGVAQAALIETDRMIGEAEVQADRAKVLAFLTRREVRDEFAALGVEADEAAARVASLSDAEVAKIADRIDGMPAGQGALSAIISAALIIAIILFITDLAGVTNVYPFVNSMR